MEEYVKVVALGGNASNVHQKRVHLGERKVSIATTALEAMSDLLLLVSSDYFLGTMSNYASCTQLLRYAADPLGRFPNSRVLLNEKARRAIYLWDAARDENKYKPLLLSALPYGLEAIPTRSARYNSTWYPQEVFAGMLPNDTCA